MSEPTPGGPEHDAWLREALRHAPDASAAPPQALRESILARARAAAEPAGAAGAAPPRMRPAAPAPTLADRIAAWWSWLARPPVAAGFASIMAATLVGLMWWDRPMDEAMVQAPPPAAPAPVPAPAAAPAQPAAPVAAPTPAPTRSSSTSPAPTPLSADASRRQALPLPTPARQSTGDASDARETREKAQSAVTRDADSLKERKDAPATLPSAPSPEPFPSRDRADADTQRLAKPADTDTLAKKAERREAQAASPRAEAEASDRKLADNVARAPTTPTAQGSAAPAARAIAPPMAQAPPAAGSFADARPLEGAAAGRARGALDAQARTRPMQRLLAALDREGDRWTRRSMGGEPMAVDAPTRAWLAGIDAGVSGWQSADEAPTADASTAGTVLLERDGRSAARVSIEAGGVRYAFGSGPAWFAPLPPEAVARLRASLPPPR